MINETNVRMLKRQKQFGKSKSIKETVKEESRYNQDESNLNLLQICENDWNKLAPLRQERSRNIRYKNGDQWGDVIYNPDTERWEREDVFLSNQGKVPLKHNFIQQFVRNLHGQLLSNKSQSVVYARAKDDASLGEMLTNTLHACQELNETDTLNTLVLEDLLMGGIACTKIRYAFFSEKNRADGKIDVVGIGRLFFNTDVEDPRLDDLRRIGEIHDYSITELIANFAQTKDDERDLREIYASVMSRDEQIGGTDMRRENELHSFLVPNSMDKCRVIEVWERLGRWVTYAHDYADGTEQITSLSLAQVKIINEQRIATGTSLGMLPEDVALIYAIPKYEYYWRASYLTPNGICIKRFETPFSHESHPYTLVTMPMIDGSVKSVLGDLIDIQRYINRLMVMKDFMMGTSAKGVLMLPEECMDGMSVEEFSKEWSKPNGIIKYRASIKNNVFPHQITNNNTDNGSTELLNLEMNFMQQISGISNAIQGHTPRSNTPSSLYAQEAQNSSLNYRILFEVFNKHVKKRDEKLLKVLMQFYDDRRHVDLNGKSYSDVAKFYEPQMVQKIIDFNMVVSQSNDTPIFRQVVDDALMGFLDKGLITLEMFLDNSSMPFAEKLKADLQKIKEQQIAMQSETPRV